MKIAGFEELTDEQLETLDAEALRAAYRALREHHIVETTALWERLMGRPPSAIAQEQCAGDALRAGDATG